MNIRPGTMAGSALAAGALLLGLAVAPPPAHASETGLPLHQAQYYGGAGGATGPAPALPGFRDDDIDEDLPVRAPKGPGYSYLVGLDPYGDNWLALRSEPSTTRGVRLKKMGPETRLKVRGREGPWLFVELTTGETGWALSRYVACCKPPSY